MKKLRSQFFFNDKKEAQSIVEKNYVDKVILGIAAVLIFIGCIMVVSSSYSASKVYKVNKIHFVIKHLIFSFLSFISMLIFAKQKKYLKSLGFLIWIFSIIGLILVFFIGHSAKGATRWISIFGVTIQPSEFAKVGAFLEGAKYAEKNWNWFLLAYLLPLSLIITQPDLGTSILIASLGVAQVLSKRLNLKLLFSGGLFFVFSILLAYVSLDHVKKRIDTFLNPTADLFGIGYQRYKAFLAIKQGGLLGKGFGKGNIKETLPDAHTDYIFASIIEEFGFLTGLFILFLFIFLSLRVLTLYQKDEYLGLVQYTSILLILGQAWLNIASVLSIIPAKGLTLPLISYGGSGLIAQGIVFGVLLASSSRKKKLL